MISTLSTGIVSSEAMVTIWGLLGGCEDSDNGLSKTHAVGGRVGVRKEDEFQRIRTDNPEKIPRNRTGILITTTTPAHHPQQLL